MKAIIEIPDDMIRSAGSTIVLSHPEMIDAVIEATNKLMGTDKLALRFDRDNDRKVVEMNTAILAITQVMEDISTHV